QLRYENCMEDIFHLLDIIEEMGNNNICEITEEDIDLVVRGYVEQKISLYYSSPNAQTLSASMYIIGLIAEAKARVIADSWYYWVYKKDELLILLNHQYIDDSEDGDDRFGEFLALLESDTDINTASLT
ncbi:809_t:CDS:2, partial [Funneliformis geosporum]